MDERDANPNWTIAYLEWMELEESKAAAARDWADAYFDWADSAPLAPRLPRLDSRRNDLFREAMALMSSRAASDCRHIAEALRHAEDLLEEEREAWRTLNALRGCDRRHSRGETPALSSAGWQDALEGIATDMHALAAKVLALQGGSRAPL